MRLYLKILKGPLRGTVNIIEADRHTIIGRYRKLSHIVISSDKTLSRQHFKIFSRHNSWWIEDLTSRNGTFVNNRRVISSQLRNGDQIKAGATVFFVSSSGHQPLSISTQAPGNGTAQARLTDNRSAENHRSRVDLRRSLLANGNHIEELGPQQWLVRDSRNRVIQLALDASGMPQRIELLRNQRWQCRFDQNGQIQELIYPSGLRITIFYGANDLPSEIHYNHRPKLMVDYTESGQPENLRYGNNQQIRWLYDGANRITGFEQGRRKEHYEYGSAGELRRIIGADKRIWRFHYSRHDRPVRVDWPDSRVSAYEFDSLGRLTTVDNGRIRLFYRSKDPNRTAHDAIAEICFADYSIRFDYNSETQPIRIDDGKTGNEFEWSASGEIAAEHHNQKTTVRYHYREELPFRLAALVYLDRWPIEFTLDDCDRPLTLKDGSGAQFEWRYDNENSATLQYPNGLIASTAFQNDGLARRRILADSSGVTLHEINLHYDEQNRVVRRQDDRYGEQTIQYDVYDQLITVTNGDQVDEQYEYDLAGNRIRSGFLEAVCDANLLRVLGDIECDYDQHGRMIERSDSVCRWTFRYDPRGQLSEASSSDGMSLEFQYDGYGRRVKKTLQTLDHHTVHQFHWAGELLIGEEVTTAELTRQYWYFYPPGEFSPVAMRIDDQLYCVHQNLTDAAVSISDAQAQLVWSAQYSTFWQPRIEHSAIDFSLLLPRCYYDSETNLYYHRHRYFDPDLGRYISPDPLGLLNSLNPYLFLQNNPLSPIRWRQPWKWSATAETMASVSPESVLLLTAPTPDLLLDSPHNGTSSLALARGGLLKLILDPSELQTHGQDQTTARLYEQLLNTMIEPATFAVQFETR